MKGIADKCLKCNEEENSKTWVQQCRTLISAKKYVVLQFCFMNNYRHLNLMILSILLYSQTSWTNVQRSSWVKLFRTILLFSLTLYCNFCLLSPHYCLSFVPLIIPKILPLTLSYLFRLCLCYAICVEQRQNMAM